jgi:HEAT repeat protein
VAEGENSDRHRTMPSLGGTSRPARSGAEPRLGGAAALPYLVEALGGEEAHERWRAAQALGEIGEQALVELVEALADPRDNVRKAASAAIYSIGEAGLDALVDALPGADPPTRREIVRLLGMIAAHLEDEQRRTSVLTALVGALARPEAAIRGQAVEALGWLGDPAAVPALLDTLAEDERAVQRKAAAALVSIGGPAVVEGLKRALDDGSPQARRIAAQALEAVERDGEAADPPGL